MSQSHDKENMTPEKFARMFLALRMPLSEEEYAGLRRIFEILSPGITECLREVEG